MVNKSCNTIFRNILHIPINLQAMHNEFHSLKCTSLELATWSAVITTVPAMEDMCTSWQTNTELIVRMYATHTFTVRYILYHDNNKGEKVCAVAHSLCKWHHVTSHTEVSYTLEAERLWAMCRVLLCELWGAVKIIVLWQELTGNG